MTTDEKIYFYLIDKVTLMPTLENVMFNFMQCAQLMFGAAVRYGIAYKQNQPGFTIYSRKYYHNFKVQISNNNHEGAIGANMDKADLYVMAEKTKISICEPLSFE